MQVRQEAIVTNKAKVTKGRGQESFPVKNYTMRLTYCEAFIL